MTARWCRPLPAACCNFIITGNKTLADTSRATAVILPKFLYITDKQSSVYLPAAVPAAAAQRDARVTHHSRPGDCKQDVQQMRLIGPTRSTLHSTVSGQWSVLSRLDTGCYSWTLLCVQSAADRPTAPHSFQWHTHTV